MVIFFYKLNFKLQHRKEIQAILISYANNIYMKNLITLKSTTGFAVLRLNQMLYALCLSYHSNTEAVLFAYLSSGWVTTMGRRLASRWEQQ